MGSLVQAIGTAIAIVGLVCMSIDVVFGKWERGVEPHQVAVFGMIVWLVGRELSR